MKVTLYGKVFASVIKDLNTGTLSWITWVDPNAITSVLLREGREDYTERKAVEHGGRDGDAEATGQEDAGSQQQLEEAGREFSPQPLGALLPAPSLN